MSNAIPKHPCCLDLQHLLPRTMRLSELEPEWLREGDSRVTMRRMDDATPATAQGLLFLCPVCFKKNNGPVGTHSIIVWFKDRGVAADREPLPGCWAVTGTSFDDLTLQPSIDISENQPGEGHGFITNGLIS
jgi:hypothetical protein